MQTAQDALVFAAASGAIVLLLVVLGYGPVRLVLPASSWATFPTAGLAGTGVLVLTSGLTAAYFSGPLALVVLSEAGALILVGLGLLLADAYRHLLPGLRDSIAVFFAGLLAVSVASWNVRGVFGYGPLAVSSWNNDILSYAYNTRHLSELGTGAPGWIIGLDSGATARADVLGTYTALIPFGVILRDPLSATMPFIAAMGVLLSLGTYVVVRGFLGGGRFLSTIASLVFLVGFPSTYNAYQGFIAERLALVVVLGAVVLLGMSRTPATVLVVQSGATAALLLAYPQTLPIEIGMGAVVVLGALASAAPPRLGRRVRMAVAFLVGTGVGALVLTSYVIERMERARALLHAMDGWAMPTRSFLEAAGLVEPFSFLTRSQSVVLEVVAILVVLCSLAVARGNEYRRTVITLLALLVPAMAFARFAVTEPDSYRQWKAMSLAAPFAVIVCVGLVLVGCRLSGLDRRFAGDHAAIPVLIVGMMLFVSNHLAFDSGWATGHCSWADCPIGSTVRAEMELLSASAGPGPVGIQRGAQWPSMVAGYFMWGRPIAMKDPTYWGVSSAPVRRVLGPDGWYAPG